MSKRAPILTQLHQQRADLDRRRRLLLDDLDPLTPRQLHFKPNTASWSILEVVQHLVLAERDVMRDLPDPATLRPQPRRAHNYVAYPLVLLVLQYGIPYPVPSPGMVPDGRTSLPELHAQWDSTHHWLHSFIDRLTPATASHSIFFHPIAGPVTTRQTLTMARLHLTCHTRQIERLKRIMPAS